MGTRPGRVQIEETGLPPVELPVLVSVWAASNPDEEPGPLEEIRWTSDRVRLRHRHRPPSDPRWWIRSSPPPRPARPGRRVSPIRRPNWADLADPARPPICARRRSARHPLAGRPWSVSRVRPGVVCGGRRPSRPASGSPPAWTRREVQRRTCCGWSPMARRDPVESGAAAAGDQLPGRGAAPGRRRRPWRRLPAVRRSAPGRTASRPPRRRAGRAGCRCRPGRSRWPAVAGAARDGARSDGRAEGPREPPPTLSAPRRAPARQRTRCLPEDHRRARTPATRSGVSAGAGCWLGRWIRGPGRAPASGAGAEPEKGRTEKREGRGCTGAGAAAPWPSLPDPATLPPQARPPRQAAQRAGVRGLGPHRRGAGPPVTGQGKPPARGGRPS